jgi:hypothetical protein
MTQLWQYAIVSSRRLPLPDWEDRGLVRIVDHIRHEEGQRRLVRKFLPPGQAPTLLSIRGTILTH